MAKNLYHSAFCKLGDITVRVDTDVLQSKYPGKPDYVGLTIDGEQYNYSTENAGCALAFDGLKGQTVELRAIGGGRGKEETAAIEIIDADASPKQGPARTAGKPASKPQAPARDKAPAGNQSAPERKPEALHPQLGIRVGACMNNAIAYLIAEGQPWNPQEIVDRTSDLLRIAAFLEKGHMSPTFTERTTKE